MKEAKEKECKQAAILVNLSNEAELKTHAQEICTVTKFVVA